MYNATFLTFRLFSRRLCTLLFAKGTNKMYDIRKRKHGTSKSEEMPEWEKCVHDTYGIWHCFECLQLDGCWFTWEKVPEIPHHDRCHCRLEAIDYLVVVMNASAYSNYSKFDLYLFNAAGKYTHGNEKLFYEWGYTVDDARWLQNEMERQARIKYVSGAYTLG